MSHFESALKKSLSKARNNQDWPETGGSKRKLKYAPYQDQHGMPIVFAFPEEIKPGSPLARINRAFDVAVEGTKAIPAIKKTIWADKNLSDEGKKFALTKWVAEHNAGKWREQWNLLDRERKLLADRVAKIKVKEPDQSPNAIREREEVRSMLRGMNDKAKNEFVQKYRHDSNSNVAAAIAERAPELSGLNVEVYENITASLLDNQHGKELSDIALMSSAIEFAERAITGGRDEARKQSGINLNEYNKILGEVESKADDEFQRQQAGPKPDGLPEDEAKEVFNGVGQLSAKQRGDLLDFMAGLWAGKKAA